MDSNKTYIIIKGGLGNQLFQISMGLLISEKTNRELIINTKLIHENTHQPYEQTIKKLKELFPTIKFTEESINNNKLILFREPNNKAFVYIDMINKINDINKNILLDGYFQNEKYIYDKFKNMIKLIPKERLLHQDFTDYYFIHIRLGDYVNNKFHYIDLIDYYNFAINDINKKNTNTKFIICTNQYDSVLTNILNKLNLTKNNYIIQDKSDDEIDTLFIMKMCKGAICSNSSLSWMGSYLQENKKENNIYMPYPWVNKISGFTHDDIIDVYPTYAIVYNTETKCLCV